MINLRFVDCCQMSKGQMGVSADCSCAFKIPTFITNPILTGTKLIAAYKTLSYFIKHHNIYASGTNDYRQISMSSTPIYTSPTLVYGIATLYTNFTSISVTDHTIFTNYERSFYVLGKNSEGQLGYGYGSLDQHLPSVVNDLPDNVTRTFLGTDYYYVQTPTALYGIGSNDNGQLGLNQKLNAVYPYQVAIPEGKQISDLSAGYSFTIAKATMNEKSNDTYYWGQVAGLKFFKPEKVRIANGASITKFSVGYTHAILVSESANKVYCMGTATQGECLIPQVISTNRTITTIDMNSTSASSTLLPFTSLSSIINITAGLGFTIVHTSNSLYGAGSNAWGTLGAPWEQYVRQPRETFAKCIPGTMDNAFDVPPNLQTMKFRSLVAGTEHFIATTMDTNELVGWGWNEFQTVHSKKLYNVRPTKLPLVIPQQIQYVTCGDQHCFALLVNGDYLVRWGRYVLL